MNTRTFKLLARAGAVLVALATTISVGCSGRTERHKPAASGAGGTSSVGQAGEPSEGGDPSWGGNGDKGGTGGTGETCDVTTCDPATSDSCVEGTCRCGEGPPCSGLAQYCAEGRCIECFEDSECAVRKGLHQCVDGTCLECDPIDGSGCGKESPGCSDEGKCMLCSENAECADSLLCDVEAGRCKACVGHSDCTDSFKPICFEFSAILSDCSACKSDEECAARDPKRGQCELNGSCVPCDHVNGDGCDHDEQCLPDGAGGYECRGCENDNECWDDNASLCDTETGTCVPCYSIDDPDGRCLQKEPGRVCVTAGEHAGSCGVCDPLSHTGCSPQQPYCHFIDLRCRECLESADCPDGFDCTLNDECVGCTTDADCENNPSGGQCVEVTGGKACRVCDPSDGAGCMPPETCWISSPPYCSVP